MVRHTIPAMGLILLSVSLQRAVPQLFPSIALGLALPVGVAWIGWAAARYLSTLDELERTIQLKAYAFSYGSVVVFAGALYSAALMTGVSSHPMVFLLVLAVGELVRGVALVAFARGFR